MCGSASSVSTACENYLLTSFRQKKVRQQLTARLFVFIR